MTGWAGIPVLGQKADGSSGWIAGTRWVDVRGSFAALSCRFGGEEGGLPICHHFTVANSDASGNADFGYARGGSIAIRDCWTYVGLAARPDAAAIVLRGEAPTSIVWEGNTGPLTSPIVLNPGAGRGIADPAAYFAAWRAATGKPDEKPFFNWRISDCRAGHFRSRSRDARNGLSRRQLTAVSERLPPATAQPQKTRPRLKRAE